MKRLLTALCCIVLVLSLLLTCAACRPSIDKNEGEKSPQSTGVTTTTTTTTAGSDGGTTENTLNVQTNKKPSQNADTSQNVTTPASGGRTIEQAVRQYLDGMSVGNSAKMLEVMADGAVRRYMNHYHVTTVAALAKAMDAEFDPADACTVGNVTIKTMEFGTPEVVDRATYIKHLEDTYGIAPSDYSEVVVIKIIAELDGEEEIGLSGCIKKGNKWYLVFGAM